MTAIIDTNVVLVANGQHPDVSPECMAACAQRLEAIMKTGRIAVDDGYEILREYQHKTQPKTGNRPGDAFVKWVLRNHATAAKCDRVPIAEHADRGYEEFPEDARLADFDAPDRKFVAVAAAHADHPPILQAADSKWLDWQDALKEHGITVELLCPQDIRRFHANKFGP